MVLLYLNWIDRQALRDNYSPAGQNIENDTLRLTFVGSIKSDQKLLETSSSNESTAQSFSPSFEFVTHYLERADLAIGSLEASFGGPLSNDASSPDHLAEALAKASFDYLFTANEHAVEFGSTGLNRTIDLLNKNGIYQVGTYHDLESAMRVQSKQVKSVHISMLAYAENVSSSSSPINTFQLNSMTEGKIKGDINKARKNNAELIVVHLYFEKNLRGELNARQEEVVEFCTKNGADIIIVSQEGNTGGFTCFEPINENLDQGVIAYSLGNFLTGQLDAFSATGAMLTIEMSKNNVTGKINIYNISVVPTHITLLTMGEQNHHVIFPSIHAVTKRANIVDSLLTPFQKERMKKSFLYSSSIFGEDTNDCAVIDRAI